MNKICLKNVYYRENKEIKEYKEIFLETDIGMLKVNITSLDIDDISDLVSLVKLNEIDFFREKYGKLYIDEVRRTYDNDMYLLISGKFILVIEYVLNSNFEQSIQEFRIIEEIDGTNKTEFDDFKELDIVNLPSYF